MSIEDKTQKALALIQKVKVSKKPHVPAECQIIDEFEAEGQKDEEGEEGEEEEEEDDDEEFEEWERERNEDDA